VSNTNQTADAILEYEADDYKHFGRDARGGDLSIPDLQRMATFWLIRQDILDQLARVPVTGWYELSEKIEKLDA
jgi:hypothetical protein